MIFVCVGSREYQFNRLLKKLDVLVGEKKINQEIFAQIGKSDYEPQNYKYKRFIDVSEFHDYQYKSDLIISHGGTGALIGALKLEKQVIAVPRLARYSEHLDDHQTQVSGVLADEGYLRCVFDIDELLETIQSFKSNPISKKYNNHSQVLSIIDQFIMNDIDKNHTEDRR